MSGKKPSRIRMLRTRIPGVAAPTTTETERRRQYDQERGSSTARGYGREWRRLREQHIRANPLCVECSKEGKTRAVEHVDHVVPHNGDRQLLLDPTNLQSLCRAHHSAKTIREGGFGRHERD